LGFTIVNGDQLESTGPLSVADSPYSITGGDTDTGGDSDSWSFSLTVTQDVIVQTPPTPGTIDVAASAAFSTTLSAASGFVAPVTFTTATSGFAITNSDELITTGTLSATDSPYTITGSDTDAYGDAGSWSYTLTVTSDTIIQGVPDSDSTSAGNSAAFSSTLSAASGFIGLVTFATTTPDFAISNGNELESTSPLTASSSPYVITGTDSDAHGDTGTWTYTLTVVASPSSNAAVLVQTSATSGTVATTSSGTFTAGSITVDHNVGPVTFVTTNSNPNLAVSSSGVITTTGSLTIGTHSVSGTDSDASGDSGTWTYALTVTRAVETVTFNANGGTGVMPPQSENEPSALSLNSFRRAKHTFIDWNTTADGSGVNYANGTVFSFTAPIELFAQWKAGKIPSRRITFRANGGSGSEAAESDNTPTAISKNHFKRTRYKFVDWNTAANGSGTTFKAGATYVFKTSVILYAQWKKVAVAIVLREVVFVANGGAGRMSPEYHHGSATLTANHFTRTHFTFVDWNSAANGSGTAYANEATFSFTSSTTLYAQWKKNKVAVVPPPMGKARSGVPVGPFAIGTSSLTPELESQIGNLTDTVKTEGKTQITLYGYGDKLTVANEHDQSFLAANLTLGRMRAAAVATYLEGSLTALGLKGWTISIEAASLAAPNSNNSDAATVFAALT
jgi:outer membrane protein OmpA-like peptidoglycan-associated protein